MIDLFHRQTQLLKLENIQSNFHSSPLVRLTDFEPDEIVNSESGLGQDFPNQYVRVHQERLVNHGVFDVVNLKNKFHS
jgi:hypothetical protein